MEPPVLQELPIEVRNTLRSGVIIPNIAQCIVELILNSLDAGASSIAIRVNLVYHKIQVVDNGCGIDMDSLNLVGLRYMTSKCTSLEDLRKYLGLFGFRGEALASLRNVSKVLKIESRPHDCDDTFYKIFKKGKSQAAIKSDTNRPSRGTTVTVNDFLYNMPVRQQRTNDAIDLEEIKSLVEAIALVHSDVSFSLRNDVNASIILHVQRTYDKLKTFSSLFGDEITNSLVPVKHSSSKFRIKGYISRDSHVQKHLQFIYVNKRVVKKTKLHAVVNAKLSQSSIRFAEQAARPNLKRKSNGNWIAYTPPTKKDKFPVYFLNIKCASIEYDICSDPKKTLIEFLDWSSVLKCLEEALQKFLEAECLVVTKESECAAVQIPVTVADQSAIEALKRCEGPVLEIGRCIRSRPAMRKETSNDTESPELCSPSQSLEKVLRLTGPDASGLQSSGSNNHHAANVTVQLRSADAVDSATSSTTSVLSSSRDRVHVPARAEFTPAPRVGRCPSEDPFPSTFEKMPPRKRIHESKAKEIRNSSPSSLSEDPIGKAKAHGKEIKRAKRSLRSFFRSLGKKPLKLSDSLSEDPINGSDRKQLKKPLKHIFKRKDVLNKVALAAPKGTRPKLIVCRASLRSAAPCDKSTPANSEEARVRHLFCHPLLTNVDDNPDFVRLQDAVTMDRLSIALKKCSSRFKRKGVLRIRETEVTINQRVAIPQELAHKTPEEIVNGLKSPYFSLGKAKDFIFKIPKLNGPILSTKVKGKEKPKAITLKSVHRSPYFTSPPITTTEYKSNVQFIFRPQPALDDSQKVASQIGEDYRLNVAPKIVIEPKMSENQSSLNRLSKRLPLNYQVPSPFTPRLPSCNKELSDDAEAVCNAFSGIKSLSLLRDKRQSMSQNSSQGSYVASSDMIQPLHRSISPRNSQEDVEGQVNHYCKEQVSSFSKKQVSISRSWNGDDKCVSHCSRVVEEQKSGASTPEGLDETTMLFHHPLEQIKRPQISQTSRQTLSPIYEECLEENSDINYKKLLSIERKYHCFSLRGVGENVESPEPDSVSLDASSGFSSAHTLCCEQEQSSGNSDNILFPQADVVFVSSDESTAQENAENEYADNATHISLVGSDRYEEQTELNSVNQNGNALSQNQSKVDHDVRIDSHSQKIYENACIALGVSDNDSVHIPAQDDDGFVETSLLAQCAEHDLEVQHCNKPSSLCSDEDIIPGTPQRQAPNANPHQSTCGKKPAQKTGAQEGLDKEWVQMFDGAGRPFFVHVRSGMTSFEPPAPVSEGFAMTKRYCFLPKGMSPILEEKSDGGKAKELSQNSRENVQKAVLDAGQAQEELSLVKWQDEEGQGGSIIEKIREFTEKNGKYCEAAVPDAFIQGRSAVKSYNLISSYTFSKEIFSCINLLGQLDKKFIVAIVNPESAGLPHLLVFFDQHAVHERVRLETLMKDYHLDGSDTHFQSSPIHPPIPVTLSEQEARMVASFGEEMRRVGLELVATPGAGTHFLATCVPTCVKLRADREAACRRQTTLQNVVETLVREMVVLLLEARGVTARVPATLQNIINSEACRGAIKFGDVLSKADCLSLLTELCQCDLPFQCAHGRPSIAPIADLRDIVKTDKVFPAPNYGNLKNYID